MRVASFLALCASTSALAPILLSAPNNSLSWRLQPTDDGAGIALGAPLFKGAPFGLPVTDGFAFWRRESDALVVPLVAMGVTVDADGTGATLSGAAVLPPAGTATTVSLRVALAVGAPSAALAVSFSAATALTGWQLCVKYAHDGAQEGWRTSAYPVAGNSSDVDNMRLDYMGWPGFWLYRADASLVSFFSLALADDFSNPLSWRGATGFTSKSSAAGDVIAPQYWFGGGGLAAGQVYEAGMRLMLSDAGAATRDTLAAVREIVPALLRLEDYAVQPMPPIRPAGDMLACFCNARRVTPMWRTTPDGSAYQLQDIANFIYLGTTPESAYFEYQLFVATGDVLWRNRTFAQMAFWLKGQNLNVSSRHFGAVHTVYELPNGPFDSTDRGNNVGYKIDLNAHMARYALLTWEALLAHEGVNQSAWLQAGARAAAWVARMAAAQAGAGAAPGSAGFPQMIAAKDDAPTPSVVSGRTMNALPVFARLLDGTDGAFAALQAAAEGFTVAEIESQLIFSGQHPDLPWWDFEQDSIWELVEYWLDRAETGAAGALERAVGDAYVALMMLCPKQLSWVNNPTQMATDEQQEYSQYTVYTYHNRKWLCLQRLAAATHDPLWQQLADRLLQLNAFTQVTDGSAQDVGGFHEAIADPWLARGGGYNFLGSVYRAWGRADTPLGDAPPFILPPLPPEFSSARPPW